MGSGCDLGAPSGDPVTTTAAPVLVDGWESVGCEYYEVNIYDNEELVGNGIVDSCTTEALGLPINNPGTGIDIYPTLVSNSLTLSSSSTINSIQIITLDGKVVLDQEFGLKRCELVTSGLSKGVYIIIVQSVSSTHSSKFIKL